MLKWTLRATAVLAIAAAVAAPVAVTAPEAVVAIPSVAVVIAASGADAPGAELTSAMSGKARLGYPVAF
ncbi:hypothetical protein OOK31_00065 [Streptomyces sp. NBC_00249]|uniref:hypothetical protein n=1 Tax=Streptomyces sp. NBC_00249 TaxID=2975690 RepID=UPI002259789A|nr:hypothetical protein [Streptomyces sp. NBC_00249]MCX5192302.1 hypothetical protein [Streptomyces sp. NBC_00249]